MAQWKVRETFLVSPPEGAAPTTLLPLTFFDVIGIMILPGERLFFYEFPTTPTNLFDSVIVPNLKRSLELTLRHFAPLAGNITWPLHSPAPLITYVPGSDSVPLTITESDEDFNLLCSNLCPVSKRRHLVPPLANTSREKSPLLALQVTLFPNYSGFCVGITMHHAAMDGNSATLFMKAWAHLCSSSPPSSHLPENLTPFFDRSAIEDKLDPKGIIAEAYVDSWLKMHGGRGLKVWERETNPNIDDDEALKCTFELTPSHIQRLRQRYYAHLQSEGKVVTTNNIKVSTFSVTYAYVLSCLAKTYYSSTRATITKQLPEAEYYSDKVGCILSVDCRHRVDPPIVPTYFGNCIAGQLAVVEKKRLLGSDGFVHALEGIIGVVNEMEKNGVLNDAGSWMRRVQSALGETGGRLFTLASSPRFGLYGIDFGWGRPKRVDVASVDGRTGVFSLCESRDVDGGVEIGVSLNKGPHVDTFVALFSQGLLQ